MSYLTISPGSFDWAVGIEDTFITDRRPGKRALEEYELTQHYTQWRADLEKAASLGIKKIRWGVPWYRVEPQPGVFDWSWVDEVLDFMVNTLHLEPIIDLVHYGTPAWLRQSLADVDYPQRVAFYAGAFTRRYHHLVKYYTPLNEPTVNCEFSGQFGEWPPYLNGDAGYVRVMLSIARGIQLTAEAIRSVDPTAVLIAVEAMHNYRADNAAAVPARDLAFCKDLLCFDLVSGDVDKNHPLYSWLKSNGAADLELETLRINACDQEILGINFYPWSALEVSVDSHGQAKLKSFTTDGHQLADVLQQVYSYTRKPLFVSETSCGGDVAQRLQWMTQTIEAVRATRASGVPVLGYTWFPLFSMIEWNYRNSQKPLADHLLHLGLWDAHFDEKGFLVRHETPLVANYRQNIRTAIPGSTKPRALTFILNLAQTRQTDFLKASGEFVYFCRASGLFC